MNPIIIILLVLLGLCVLVGIWSLIEPFLLDITHLHLSSSPIEANWNVLDSRTEASQTPSSPALKVFFFSDLHAEMCMISSARLLKAIERAKNDGGLDAVVFGGDIITWNHFRKSGIRYLSRISDGCRNLGIPFIGVSGNHDCHMTPEELKACGFDNLELASVTLPSRDATRTFAFSGMDDSGRDNRVWYEAPKPSTTASDNVLIVHDPDALLHISSTYDYALTGHLHGGQLKLPSNLVFKIIRKDELPMIGVVEGAFAYHGTSVFISRGLGCGTLPIRLLSRPEASIISFD